MLSIALFYIPPIHPWIPASAEMTPNHYSTIFTSLLHILFKEPIPLFPPSLGISVKGRGIDIRRGWRPFELALL
jgi:hypothetical protein